MGVDRVFGFSPMIPVGSHHGVRCIGIFNLTGPGVRAPGPFCVKPTNCCTPRRPSVSPERPGEMQLVETCFYHWKDDLSTGRKICVYRVETGGFFSFRKRSKFCAV